MEPSNCRIEIPSYTPRIPSYATRIPSNTTKAREIIIRHKETISNVCEKKGNVEDLLNLIFQVTPFSLTSRIQAFDPIDVTMVAAESIPKDVLFLIMTGTSATRENLCNFLREFMRRNPETRTTQPIIPPEIVNLLMPYVSADDRNVLNRLSKEVRKRTTIDIPSEKPPDIGADSVAILCFDLLVLLSFRSPIQPIFKKNAPNEWDPNVVLFIKGFESKTVVEENEQKEYTYKRNSTISAFRSKKSGNTYVYAKTDNQNKTLPPLFSLESSSAEGNAQQIVDSRIYVTTKLGDIEQTRSLIAYILQTTSYSESTAQPDSVFMDSLQTLDGPIYNAVKPLIITRVGQNSQFKDFNRNSLAWIRNKNNILSIHNLAIKTMNDAIGYEDSLVWRSP
jgi:hypothetical protein